MMQDRMFAIVFLGAYNKTGHDSPAHEADYKSLEVEYDKIGAQVLYWVFFVNLRVALSESNVSMAKIANDLELDIYCLEKM